MEETNSLVDKIIAYFALVVKAPGRVTLGVFLTTLLTGNAIILLLTINHLRNSEQQRSIQNIDLMASLQEDSRLHEILEKTLGESTLDRLSLLRLHNSTETIDKRHFLFGKVTDSVAVGGIAISPHIDVSLPLGIEELRESVLVPLAAIEAGTPLSSSYCKSHSANWTSPRGKAVFAEGRTNFAYSCAVLDLDGNVIGLLWGETVTGTPEQDREEIYSRLILASAAITQILAQ